MDRCNFLRLRADCSIKVKKEAVNKGSDRSAGMKKKLGLEGRGKRGEYLREGFGSKKSGV